jgi:hypothetical protein
MTNKERLELAEKISADMDKLKRSDNTTYGTLEAAISDMDKFILHFKHDKFCPRCGGDV